MSRSHSICTVAPLESLQPARFSLGRVNTRARVLACVHKPFCDPRSLSRGPLHFPGQLWDLNEDFPVRLVVKAYIPREPCAWPHHTTLTLSMQSPGPSQASSCVFFQAVQNHHLEELLGSSGIHLLVINCATPQTRSRSRERLSLISSGTEASWEVVQSRSEGCPAMGLSPSFCGTVTSPQESLAGEE